MKVLIIDDNRTQGLILQEYLSKEHFCVEMLKDGRSGLKYALNQYVRYDIALIKRTLPFVDGLTILQEMRHKHIKAPVIMIAESSDLRDKLKCFDCGADDYLIHPILMDELSARMRALLRRTSQIMDPDCLNYSDLFLLPSRHQLICGASSVVLTKRETVLLEYLLMHPNSVFSQEHLILKIWGADSEVESGNVDNYIYFLRKRLKSLNSRVKIRSIYGCGFTLGI